MTHCCSFEHFLFYIFILEILFPYFLKVFRLPFELFENFNSLFTNKNYFIICKLMRPLWTIAFYSHFCLCIKWDYFVLLNSLFAFPCVFLLVLPSTAWTFFSFQFFWLPLMKWLTIYEFSECGLIRASPPPQKKFWLCVSQYSLFLRPFPFLYFRYLCFPIVFLKIFLHLSLKW